MFNRLNSVFLLGFASGLPFLLVLSTLSVWLAEVGTSKTSIGLFALASLPYSLKFLWSPVVDNYRIPILSDLFGLRRSWILFMLVLLAFNLIALGNTNPAENFLLTAFFASMASFCSAILDIVVEAYRIEIIPDKSTGIAVSASVLGYRIGMLCAGAGTIFFSAYFNSWAIAYFITASLLLVGIIATLRAQEPKITRHLEVIDVPSTIKKFLKNQDWLIIIAFIILFKIADTVLNVMSMPFLLEIGFNKIEIASVAKTFGISAMIIGGFVGGLLLLRQTIRQNLITCVLLQMVASMLFVVQAKIGNNLSFLFLSMGVENLVCGMGQVALIAYLSKLCGLRTSATDYALLSSFASFARVSFSSFSGILADTMPWTQFYSWVAFSSVPTILVLIFAANHFKKISQEKSDGDQIRQVDPTYGRAV